jgi:hypothetical protein
LTFKQTGIDRFTGGDIYLSLEVALVMQERRSQPSQPHEGVSVTADLLKTARLQGYDFDVLAKPVHPADLLAKLRHSSHHISIRAAPAVDEEGIPPDGSISAADYR